MGLGLVFVIVLVLLVVWMWCPCMEEKGYWMRRKQVDGVDVPASAAGALTADGVAAAADAPNVSPVSASKEGFCPKLGQKHGLCAGAETMKPNRGSFDAFKRNTLESMKPNRGSFDAFRRNNLEGMSNVRASRRGTYETTVRNNLAAPVAMPQVGKGTIMERAQRAVGL